MSINPNEEFIKRAFLQDIETLKEKAKTEGVTAYAHKPSRPTLRPNQRFLRNTIASVEHANRRTQEKEMWARRKAQLEREGSFKDLQGASPSAAASDDDNKNHNSERDGDTPSKEKEEEDEPEENQTFTAHHRIGNINITEEDEPVGGVFRRTDGGGGGSSVRKVRGRGGTGPRIGPTGAYVPDPDIGLDCIIGEKRGLKRKIGPLEPEEGLKDGSGVEAGEGESDRSNDGDGGNSSNNSPSTGKSSESDTDGEEEERRRIRRKKRRRKEDRKKKKKKRRKEKKKEKKSKKSGQKDSKRRHKSRKRRRNYSSSDSPSLSSSSD